MPLNNKQTLLMVPETEWSEHKTMQGPDIKTRCVFVFFTPCLANSLTNITVATDHTTDIHLGDHTTISIA